MHDRLNTTPITLEAPRSRKGLWLFLIVVVALAAFVGGYKLRGRMNAEMLLTAYAKYVDHQPSHKQAENVPAIPEVMQTDFRRLIDIHAPSDVERVRKQAIDYVWRGKNVAYADLRPDAVARDSFFLPLEDIRSIATMDRLSVFLPFGVSSEVFHLKPRDRRSCLMLYQEGHRVSFVERKRFLKRMLDEGCDVLALSFPLTGGLNNRPGVDHPRFGRILLNDPDDLRLLDSEDGSFLYYFLAPMVAALNHVLAENHYERIGATGFSGGGWAVQVLAALDPRIQASYAVAGSAPLNVHAARPAWGSPEQTDARFYEIVNYPELYTMGAVGPGRRQRQFFNLTDPCCFSGTNWDAYRVAVAERARALGGDFRVLSYESSEHRLTKPVGLAIVDDFLNGGKALPEGITAHD